jgi:hypothetical protein
LATLGAAGVCFGTSFDILAAASKRPVETARAKAKVWKEAEKVKQVGRTGPGQDFYRAGWDFYRAGWDFYRAGWDFYRAGWILPGGDRACASASAHGWWVHVDRRSFRRTTNSRR